MVWQIETLSGRLAPPVSVEAVIIAPAPTFTVATANTPACAVAATIVGFGTFTIPSWLSVAARATMSGMRVAEAVSNSVLTPEIIGAGLVFVQSKFSRTSVGETAVNGV